MDTNLELRRRHEALAPETGADWMTRQEEHRAEEWALRCELIEAGRGVLKQFTDGTRTTTLGDAARAFALASKLGRLASGLATDKTESEIAGEQDRPIRVELNAALDRIYGVAAPLARAVNIEPSSLTRTEVKS